MDDGSSDAAGDPVLTRADNGALAAAWKVDEHGAGAVAVLERRADGTPNRQLVSAPGGGTVHQLDLGASHHGDALIGFLQGDGANTKIAARRRARPAGRVRARHARPAGSTPRASPCSGKPRSRAPASSPTACSSTTAKSPKTSPRPKRSSAARRSPNGVHTIQVEATDSLGQVVDSVPATLKIDRTPPRVRVRVRGGSVTVRVSDGPSGQSSGVDAGSVHVSFGDRRHAPRMGAPMLTHRYAAGGSYTITVTASDRAGNRVSVRRRVRVS